MKVTILDYGAGNVPSVERALVRLGAASQRASSPECISNAEVLLLPGVGHYAALVRALDEKQLRAPLVDAIHRGVPFLGICLGLQVLFKSSEEAAQLHGLHVLPGIVSALPSNVKLPHMGWNQLARKRDSSLLAGIDPGAFFILPTPTRRSIRTMRQPPLARMERNSLRSSSRRMSTPCNSIRKKAAPPERAFCTIS